MTMQLVPIVTNTAAAARTHIAGFAHQAAVHYYARPYCLPQAATDALDTAQFWAKIVAAALAVVALIFVGIGIYFQSGQHDGGNMMKKLGWWIFGVTIASAAVGIAQIFIHAPTDCTPVLS